MWNVRMTVPGPEGVYYNQIITSHGGQIGEVFRHQSPAPLALCEVPET